MKKVIFFISTFFMISLITACLHETSDETLVKPMTNTEFRSSNDILHPDSTYNHNGTSNKLGRDITESDSMSVIYGYGGSTYVFDGDAVLRSWTSGNVDRSRIREVVDTMNLLKLYENEPNGEEDVQAFILPKGWLYRDKDKQGPAWSVKGWTYGSRNNTASSYLLVLGGAVICDKKWWNGKKVFLIGLPGGWDNLDIPYYFEDRAESGWDI